MSLIHEPMIRQGGDLVDCSAALPCPFCGGEVDPAGWLGHSSAGVVTRGPECDGCGATTETIEAWNRREPSNELVAANAEIARMKAAMEGKVRSWISCAEQMPPKNTTCSVWVIADSDGREFHSYAELSSEGWETLHAGSEYMRADSLFADFGLTVTHWRIDDQTPPEALQQSTPTPLESKV